MYDLFSSQYQLALYQISSMRKDGQFVGADGNIPEGQAIVSAHLNECHQLLEMLKEAMDEGETEEEFEDEDDEERRSGADDGDEGDACHKG